MTTEPDPTLDDAPLDSAAKAEETRPTRPAFDRRTQLACGSGFAVAVIGLIGGLVGAWSFDFTGLILIVAGLVAFGTAYITFGRERFRPAVAARDLILGGGTIAAALGILSVAEIPFAMEVLDQFGGVLGLVLSLGLAVAGVVLYYAATEWWDDGPAAPWTTVLASGDRATVLVLIGAAMVLVGWLVNVTIGLWFLRAGAEVITLILLAALVMRAAADPEQPLRLPLPPAFVALGLAILAAIIAVQHMAVFLGEIAGFDDWLGQLLYIGGVVVVIVGAGLGATESARTLTEGTPGSNPSA